MEQLQAIAMKSVMELVMVIMKVRHQGLSELLLESIEHRLVPKFFSSLLGLLDQESSMVVQAPILQA